MTKQEEIRAKIIAEEAKRSAEARPPGAPKKPRSNWAASASVPHSRSFKRPAAKK